MSHEDYELLHELSRRPVDPSMPVKIAVLKLLDLFPYGFEDEIGEEERLWCDIRKIT